MLHRFTESTIHSGDQPGPPSPCMGERGHNVNVSIRTSNFTVGNSQKHCESDLSKYKVKPIRGDG